MRRRFKTILAALTLIFAVISVTLYANKGFEITYDIFGVQSQRYGCENCGAYIWHIDVETINDDLYVLNIQCRGCHSEFHLEDPVLLSTFLGNN